MWSSLLSSQYLVFLSLDQQHSFPYLCPESSECKVMKPGVEPGVENKHIIPLNKNRLKQRHDRNSEKNQIYELCMNSVPT